MKKTISVFLSILMLLSITAGLDFSAFALGSSGSCGGNVTYTFNSSTGVLTIKGKGNMKDYHEGADDASSDSPFYYSHIKTVIISSGVTSIGSYAFYDCDGLTSITIPSSVTSIGDHAFDDCGGLTSITIPNGVKSIGDFAFSGCFGLTRIKIPDSITSIGYYAFSDTGYDNNKKNWDNGGLYIGKCLIKTGACDGTCDEIRINGGTRLVADGAFDDYEQTLVAIPSSVKYLGEGLFISTEYIYYESNKKNWKKIKIADGNPGLDEAHFVFNARWLQKCEFEKNKYVYNGKTKKPKLIILDQKGEKIPKTCYKIKYSKGRKEVGKYYADIKLDSAYSSFYYERNDNRIYFKIVPKSTSITSAKGGNKNITVKWKKQSAKISSGYQIEYSRYSKFRNKEILNIKGNKKTKATLKDLDSYNDYYIRIRTYKKVKGKKYYSEWSKTKKATAN